MHFDTGAIQRNGFDLDANDLLLLQLFKDPVEYAALGPAIHSGVNGVPVAEAFRQASPLAAMLGHIKNGIENLQVAEADIATLAGQAGFDLFVLGSGQFHGRIISNSVNGP